MLFIEISDDDDDDDQDAITVNFSNISLISPNNNCKIVRWKFSSVVV